MAKSPARYMGSVWVKEGLQCADCGFGVLLVACNSAMATTEPYAGSDWWGYCGNKTCPNHEGEEWGQEDPEWVVRRQEDEQST